MKKIYAIVSDKIFLISLAVALITFLVGMPSNDAIDWQTIFSLFIMMLAVQVFSYLGILSNVAQILMRKVSDERTLVLSFVLLAFLGSMILTNDVAILALIPLFAIVWKRTETSAVFPVTLICVFANLGSAVLPTGNPQNIFLYTYYSIPLFSFLKMGAFLGAISILLLFLFSLFITKKSIKGTSENKILNIDRKK